jgi:NAD(P)-dependent dehydrogenase (short-subunit alcohol dehydrogenase family)
MTRALAKEVGKYNINVNCISPGSVDTGKKIPPPMSFLGRLGKPGDVVKLILFLASDDSNFITGQNYIIDGGRVISTKCI